MTEKGKITEGKLNYEIDWEFITLLAERMQKGKEKYGAYSWHGPTNVDDLKQALFRHVLEIMKGNYMDDDQLHGHIGAATANLMMIYYQIKKQQFEKELKHFNLTELVKEYPNDIQLGEAIRKLVN